MLTSELLPVQQLQSARYQGQCQETELLGVWFTPLVEVCVLLRDGHPYSSVCLVVGANASSDDKCLSLD
jgi:hypothetical protein